MKTTLFLPDISGFTSFVKTTEIKHSAHIVNELIEEIIDHGQKYFEVAEVEGDAVFFYRKDTAYPASELIDIAKEIAAGFYRHIDLYDKKRICECGACTSAVNLKLKFIAHAGEVDVVQTNRQTKPFGTPVIEAHRLLKNKVGQQEYILFSNAVANYDELDPDGTGMYEDETLGQIPYSFILTKDWPHPEAEVDPFVYASDHDLVVSKHHDYAISIEEMHEFLISFENRKYWIEGIDELIYNKHEVNQAGTEHRCLINGKDLLFDTIKPADGGKYSFGEILKTPEPFKYVETGFYLTALGEKMTRVELKFQVDVKTWWQKLFRPLLKIFMNKQARNILSSIEKGLKEYASRKDHG